MVFQHFFGVSKAKAARVARLPLASIQRSLREALAGCHGMTAERLRYKVELAHSPAELWSLRSDLHQCIAQAHTEGTAADRINRLSAVFAGWVPASQLTRIDLDSKPPRK